jgi:hypothetical protein
VTELLISPAGTPMRVDDPARAEQLKSEGWSQGSAEASAAYAKQEELGGIGGTAQAFGAGAVRALSFGGTDYLGAQLGYGEHLRSLREVNPLASTTGEVVGTAAALAIPVPAAEPRRSLVALLVAFARSPPRPASWLVALSWRAKQPARTGLASAARPWAPWPSGAQQEPSRAQEWAFSRASPKTRWVNAS